MRKHLAENIFFEMSHAQPWGKVLLETAVKILGAEMGTRKFDILTNLVVNTYFCILMTMFMTWFSMCVRGNAPIGAVPGGFLEMIGPVWVCCFVTSLLTQHPAIRIAKQLCGLDKVECGR